MNRDQRQEIELRPARLGRALRRGFADAYDRLGLVLASSVIWSLAVLVPAAVGAEVQRRAGGSGPWFVLAGVALAAILGAPLTVGVFRMAYKIVYRNDPSLGDLLWGFRELLGASYVLIGLHAAVAATLATDAAFFLGITGPLGGNRALAVVGLLFVYALVAWLMMGMYQLPALAAQRPLGQQGGVRQAVKKSFLLLIGSPGFTIGIFAVILGFGILCAASVVGMLILYMGTASVVLTHALRELYVRYGIVEEPPEVVEDRGWHS